MRDVSSVPPGSDETRPVSGVSANHRTQGAVALTKAVAPLDFGEAPRIGLLGDPGGGKTQAAQAIVAEYLRRSPGFVLVIDAKGERRFDNLPGAVICTSPADYAGKSLPSGTRVIIFRAPLTSDVDPEAIARFAVGLSERRWPSLTVHDELAQATAGVSWKRNTVILPRTFIRGRTQQLAQVWCTTSPHDVPTAVFECSDVIWQFKTSGMAIDLLGRRNYLRGIDPEIIENLAGYPAPPAERGEFVALVRGQPWDGAIYKF